jgi:outer membrane protein OmpA-like peptidoglycan-associated protein/outer membrane protein W
MTQPIRAIAICLLFLCPAILLAAPERTIERGIGLDFAAGRLMGGDDGSTIRLLSGLAFSHYFSNQFAMRMALNYGAVTPRQGSSLFSAANEPKVKTILLTPSLHADFYWPKTQQWQPFFQAGTGLLVWDVRKEIMDKSLFSDGLFYGKSIYDGPQFSMTVIFGAGVQYRLNDHWILKSGLSWTHIFDQRQDNIGIDDANNTLLEIKLGIDYLFRGPKDSDGDGIYDALDADPYNAEDFDGFQDHDGAPDLDNDLDGVPDEFDQAPLIPEDRDGFQDEDGIPDPDNDWDGILDINDAAPNEPEDFDGYQDEDGAPDNDNDGDGVPDLVDLCPEEAETYNDYRDDDGCPDEKPAQFVEQGKSIVLPGIKFESNSAKLRPESYPILENVYESLYANPEINIRIIGYTDNVGSKEYNLQLSLERANTVRNYLLSKGIDSSRIQAEGKGEDSPVASNETEAGKSQNRRIEFRRMD